VLAKVTAHWVLTGLPLVIVAPLIGLQYHLPETSRLAMMLSLLVGTPVLSLIGAIGAALTLGLRGGGILLSLLILPLYIPVLVYGAGAVTVSAVDWADTQPFFSLLGAFLLLALLFAPLAAAAALRISME
jgi:heme exporter protein B